jgi:hypothetical protein
MSQECGVIFDNDGAPPRDTHGCRLSHGHKGPHEFVDTFGDATRWETDWECDCDWCQSCQGDYCMIYWRVKDEAPKDGTVDPIAG